MERHIVIGGVFACEDDFHDYMKWIKENNYTYEDSFKDRVLEKYFELLNDKNVEVS